jgi:flagellar FliL protein
MADKKAPAQAAPEAAEAAPQPRRGKKTLIIVLIAVILLASAGGAAFFLMQSHDDDDDDDDDDTQKVQVDKKKEEAEIKKKQKEEEEKNKKHSVDVPPIFVKLDKFTVNLRASDNYDASYMQADITLEVDSPDADARLKTLMPRIRNDITLIMSDKQADAIMSKEGKESLADEIRDAINRIADPSWHNSRRAPEGPVQEVLFESIIIQ